MDEGKLESNIFRVSAILGNFFFAMNHWIFTWLYFSTACLFKLSFGEHSVESLQRLMKRKRCLTMASVLAYLFFSTVTIFLVVTATKDENIFNFNSNFYTIFLTASAVFVFILTLLSLSAMRYIQQNSLKL